MSRSRTRGFTLIELMIVVAVIGLLAAVAYPSYADSVRKGKRAQGRAALADLMLQQERYMTQRNCYLGFVTDAAGVPAASAPVPAGACGGLTPADVPMKVFSGDTPAQAAYFLSASSCTGAGIDECVQLMAVPRFVDPEVGTLVVTSTSLKDCTGTAQAANFRKCWP
jgi:type IV pilus assembly protein PilE